MIGRFCQRTPLEAVRQQAVHQSRRGRHRERGSRRKKGGKGPLISFFGNQVYLDELDHTAVIAQSGAGKNLLSGPTVRSLIEAVTDDPSRRLLIVEAKGDLLQALEGMGVPYHLLTFSYREGVSQDMGRDYASSGDIAQLGYNIIPFVEGNNAFFSNGARAIDIAGTVTLLESMGDRWSLRDKLEFGFSTPEVMKSILSRTALGQRVVDTFFVGEEEETLYKLRSELASRLWPLMVAAGKSEVSDPLSIVDFWEGKTDAPILVVKLNPRRLDAEYPMAAALIQRSFDHIMGLIPPNPAELRKEKLVFLDDLNFYRRIPKLLEATELIRGCGGLILTLIQSVEGLRSRRSYGDEADAILANFANIVMLRSMSPITAKWFASLFGQHHAIKDSWGMSYGKEGVQGRADEREHIENRVLDSAFLNMTPPSPEEGITCYLKTATFGEELEKVIPWEQVIQRLPPRKSVVLTPLPHAFQVPSRWTQQERELLTKGKRPAQKPRTDGPQTREQQQKYDEFFEAFDEEIRGAVFDMGWDWLERLGDDLREQLEE